MKKKKTKTTASMSLSVCDSQTDSPFSHLLFSVAKIQQQKSVKQQKQKDGLLIQWLLLNLWQLLQMTLHKCFSEIKADSYVSYCSMCACDRGRKIPGLWNKYWHYVALWRDLALFKHFVLTLRIHWLTQMCKFQTKGERQTLLNLRYLFSDKE